MSDKLSKNIETIYPLSPTQHGMLYHSMLAPRSGVYVPQCVIELAGELNAAALTSAWQALIDRHAVFRTLFIRLSDDKPLQVVLKSAPLPLRQLDWRDHGDRNAAFEILLHEEWTQPFEFFRAPLMRLVLVRWEERVHRLIWTHHHALSDGWSTPIIFRELFALYTAACAGGSAGLSPAVPYRTYIQWLGQQDLQQAEQYWQRYLWRSGGATGLALAARQGREPVQRGTRSDYEWLAEPELGRALTSAASNAQVTLNVIMQAMWGLLLARLNEIDEVVFGATVAGRPPEIPGVESIVGQFVNSVPVRLQLRWDQPLLEWLQEVQQSQAGRDRYCHLSLVDIKRVAGMVVGELPFQSLIVFENYPMEGGGDARSMPGLQARILHSVSQNNYPLSLVVFPDERLRIKYKYDPACLDHAAVICLARCYGNLLCALATGESRLVGDFVVQDPQWRRSLLERGRARAALMQERCSIVELFERAVDRHGDEMALEDERGGLSYRELDEQVNRLAHYLRELGVVAGRGVALLLGRERAQVVALLAVLKCGGWYVPIDPRTPAKRIAKVLKASAVAAVISRVEHVGALVQGQWEGELVALDRDADEIGRCDRARLGAAVGSESAAYVIYTSGSTGEPKGVVVSHGSVHNYVVGLQERLGLGAAASYAALSTVAADLGYTALYGALLSGGRLRLLAEELNLDAQGLSAALRAHPVQVLKIVPSHLRALLQAMPQWSGLPEVLILGGERLEWELVERIRAVRGGCRIFNHYGPTETTVGVLCAEVPRERAAGEEQVPLGRALAGVEVQVLDRWLEPVVPGGSGELYVGGACLALGYWGAAGQTAQRFVAHAHAQRGGERLYRTGDRVRVGEQGALYFLGRADEQVKIRGHRVELNEITQVLRGAAGVTDAAVVFEEGRLQAYVTGAVEREALEGWLAQELPQYMQPERVNVLERVPLNASGKLDRAALAGLVPPGKPAVVQGPRDEREAQLAQIWRELLRREHIGIHENFFDCGGNSLLLIQVHAAIRQRLNCELDVVDLFHYPTIAKLARRIDGNSPTTGTAECARQRRKSGQVARRRKQMQRRNDAPSSVL